MAKVEVIPLDTTFNIEMLDILSASPIRAGGLKILFDKSPDLFAIARMKYTDSVHRGFVVDGKLKGFSSLGFFKALVEANVEEVFTFYHFYLLPEARGKKIPLLAMREFFELAKGKANYGLSITMKGNRSAESYIGSRPGEWMPPTKIIDDLVVKSIFMVFPHKNHSAFIVRRAQVEDIPDIVNLLKHEHMQRDFGLVIHEVGFINDLGKRGLSIGDYFVAVDRKGKIAGVCLAWDCSALRRTRLLGLTPVIYPLWLGLEALGRLMHMAPFPRKGGAFKELTITDYAVRDRNPAIMHALLSEVHYRHCNGTYHMMNWGSCASDPMLKAAKGMLHRNVSSHIIFTSLDPSRYNRSISLPYVDIAFL
jgi:hypothetical protein